MTIKSLYEATIKSSSDVKDGEAYVAKVVATTGYDNDWALYIGPSDWSDEEVKSSGNKLPEGEVPFSYLMELRTYRR